jgi:hypothetical protein
MTLAPGMVAPLKSVIVPVRPEVVCENPVGERLQRNNAPIKRRKISPEYFKILILLGVAILILLEVRLKIRNFNYC